MPYSFPWHLRTHCQASLSLSAPSRRITTRAAPPRRPTSTKKWERLHEESTNAAIPRRWALAWRRPLRPFGMPMRGAQNSQGEPNSRSVVNWPAGATGTPRPGPIARNGRRAAPDASYSSSPTFTGAGAAKYTYISASIARREAESRRLTRSASLGLRSNRGPAVPNPENARKRPLEEIGSAVFFRTPIPGAWRCRADKPRHQTSTVPGIPSKPAPGRARFDRQRNERPAACQLQVGPR